MQYISSLFGLPTANLTMPNVFLFDTRDGINPSEITTLDLAVAAVPKARTVLGAAPQANLVRGQAGGRYHLTSLKLAVKDIPAAFNPMTQVNTVGLSPQCSDGVSMSFVSIEQFSRWNGFAYIHVVDKSPVLIGPNEVIASLRMPEIGGRGGNSGWMGYLSVSNRVLSADGTSTSSITSTSVTMNTGDYKETKITNAPAFKYMAMYTGYALVNQNGYTSPEPIGSFLGDGKVYYDKTGIDESVRFDFGLFYWAARSAFVKLDAADIISDSNIVPGTRPKVSFKISKFSDI